MKKTLNSHERQALKKQAHHLNPVIIIGQNGLSEGLIRETDCALKAHQLIKIRMMSDERDSRRQAGEELALKLNAHLIDHIGKILILWRENKEKKTTSTETKTS